jgi:hypothetical protein
VTRSVRDGRINNDVGIEKDAHSWKSRDREQKEAFPATGAAVERGSGLTGGLSVFFRRGFNPTLCILVRGYRRGRFPEALFQILNPRGKRLF